MRVLGIIPARGGSQRVPRKNLRKLGGKPLLSWTVEAAQASGVLDQLVISTEDEEIGKLYPELWWPRNPKLATSESPMLPVVHEVLEKVDADIIILLQPTSPFRTSDDIVKSLDLLTSSNGDAVISVTEAPSDLCFEVGFAQRLRHVPNVVVPNGALFLITKESLDRGESWFSACVQYAYRMPKERSIDIDTEQDFEIARMLVNSRKDHVNPTKQTAD